VKPARYSNFDYLRLYLALAVASFHGWHSTNLPYKDLPFMVPAFLGISGFVILPSLESSKGTGHFFWKRLLRVMPGFVAALIVVAVLYGARFIGPTLTSWYTFGFVRGNGKDPVLWSLSCEEVIYFCVAVLYLLGAYKRPAVIWIMWAVSTVLEAWYMPSLSNFGTNVAMLPSAFLIGNLFYIYRDRLKVNSWIPVASFAVLLAYYPFRPDSFTLQYLHQSLLIAAIVWTGFAAPQIKWRLPIDISYGVYVYHWMIILQIARPGMDLYKIIGLTFLILIPVSIISALLIERPALRLKDWLWWKGPVAQPAVLEPEPAG
jgi:peptidoglycan/LPS O-acetylase OafA/YrhL